MSKLVDIAVDSDFSLDNLPYGVFSTAANTTPRIGIAIGTHIIDIQRLGSAGVVNLVPNV